MCEGARVRERETEEGEGGGEGTAPQQVEIERTIKMLAPLVGSFVRSLDWGHDAAFLRHL